MASTSQTSNPFRDLAKERTLCSVEFTVGATGAVGTLSGAGFGTGPLKGSVTRTGVGVYDFVMPGSGSLPNLQLLSIHLVGSSELIPLVTARDLSARKITITFKDQDTPAATDPTQNDVLVAHFLMTNTTVR